VLSFASRTSHPRCKEVCRSDFFFRPQTNGFGKVSVICRVLTRCSCGPRDDANMVKALSISDLSILLYPPFLLWLQDYWYPHLVQSCNSWNVCITKQWGQAPCSFSKYGICRGSTWLRLCIEGWWPNLEQKNDVDPPSESRAYWIRSRGRALWVELPSRSNKHAEGIHICKDFLNKSPLIQRDYALSPSCHPPQGCGMGAACCITNVETELFVDRNWAIGLRAEDAKICARKLAIWRSDFPFWPAYTRMYPWGAWCLSIAMNFRSPHNNKIVLDQEHVSIDGFHLTKFLPHTLFASLCCVSGFPWSPERPDLTLNLLPHYYLLP